MSISFTFKNLQISHLNFLYFECEWRWTFKVPFSANFLLQILHLKGFIPLCDNSWTYNLYPVLKLFSHSGYLHLNWAIFLWTPFICFFKTVWFTNDFSHFGHFGLKCYILYLLYHNMILNLITFLEINKIWIIIISKIILMDVQLILINILFYEFFNFLKKKFEKRVKMWNFTVII